MRLILTWAGMISFIIITYVLLDGFDLGIGVLFPWVKDSRHRDIMMTSVAPVWDGNETWLVFGAAALYAAFPLAYGLLLPTLYMPLMIMLLALIFRGVAFEFRFKAQKSQFIWDTAFAGGSIVAALMQGAMLGTFVQGYGENLSFTPLPYQWMTPFSVFTAIAVTIGYALLGSTWLIIKTAGKLQAKMYQAAQALLALVTFCLVIVSLWTPMMEPRIRERWFTFPNYCYLAVLPLLTVAAIGYNFYYLRNKKCEKAPFVLSIGLFIFSYIGFGVSAWPYIIPYTLKVWDAAAPASSLSFTLVGASILLPILLGYTLYAYHVFRGKITQAHY